MKVVWLEWPLHTSSPRSAGLLRRKQCSYLSRRGKKPRLHGACSPFRGNTLTCNIKTFVEEARRTFWTGLALRQADRIRVCPGLVCCPDSPRTFPLAGITDAEQTLRGILDALKRMQRRPPHVCLLSAVVTVQSALSYEFSTPRSRRVANHRKKGRTDPLATHWGTAFFQVMPLSGPDTIHLGASLGGRAGGQAGGETQKN